MRVKLSVLTCIATVLLCLASSTSHAGDVIVNNSSELKDALKQEDAKIVTVENVAFTIDENIEVKADSLSIAFGSKVTLANNATLDLRSNNQPSSQIKIFSIQSISLHDESLIDGTYSYQHGKFFLDGNIIINSKTQLSFPHDDIKYDSLSVIMSGSIFVKSGGILAIYDTGFSDTTEAFLTGIPSGAIEFEAGSIIHVVQRYFLVKPLIYDNDMPFLGHDVGADFSEVVDDSTTVTYGRTITAGRYAFIRQRFIKEGNSNTSPLPGPNPGQNPGVPSPENDRDQDGLDDRLEVSGMKDQYGAIWKTNPTTADTDGDGIKDGDELVPTTGTLWNHHKLVSNPTKRTISSKKAYIEVSDAMFATHDIENKLIDLTIDITDRRYRDEDTQEILFAEVDDMQVELIIPAPFNEHFTIYKQPWLRYTTEENESDKSKTMTYRASISYDGGKVPALSTLTWRITARNIDGAIEEHRGLDFNNLQIDSRLLSAASNALFDVTTDFVNEIKKGMEEKVSEADAKLKEIKSFIKPSGASNVPDKIYEVFALAIMEAVSGSKIAGYESDMKKLVDQVGSQIRNGFSNKEVTVEVDGTTYNVNYSIQSMNGVFSASAFVTGDKTRYTLTGTNYNTASGVLALSEYCAILAQLNTDVWKDVMAHYIADLATEVLGPIKFTASGKKIVINYKNSRSALDNAEKMIKALCNKEYANKLIAGFSAEAREYLKGSFINPSSKKLLKFLEDMVPGSKDVLKNVGRLSETIDAFRKYEQKLAEYQTIANKEGVEKATEQTKKLFNEFGTLYQSLGEIDIFKENGFKSILELADSL